VGVIIDNEFQVDVLLFELGKDTEDRLVAV